jgi:hypothetical protein
VLDAVTSYEQSPWRHGLLQSFAARTWLAAAARKRADTMVDGEIIVVDEVRK